MGSLLVISAIILAGGRGRRLGGVDKPALVRGDGTALLQAGVDALKPLVDDGVVVCPAARQAHIEAALPRPEGFRWVADPGQGPVLAVYAGLASTAGDLVVWAPSDLVRPSPRLWARLIRVARADKAGAVVEAEGILQAALAVVPRASLPASPPRSLQGLLRSAGVTTISADELDPDERAGLRDVDEPGDLIWLDRG